MWLILLKWPHQPPLFWGLTKRLGRPKAVNLMAENPVERVESNEIIVTNWSSVMLCSRQVLTGDCFNTTEECLHILFALSFILVEVCSGTSVTFATIAEFFMGMVTFDVGCKNKRNLINAGKMKSWYYIFLTGCEVIHLRKLSYL